MRRNLIIVVVAGVGLAALFILVRAFIRHYETEMMEHKSARTTTGIVVDKKHIEFTKDQTSYRDDEGRWIPVEAWRRREGEYRVFYRIDNFDQIPEGDRRALAAAEKARFESYGARFTIPDRHSYDLTTIGDPVIVRYRWADDSKIEVISVERQGTVREGKP